MENTYSQKQLWEVWPGKNRFFLKGKIMMGPRSDLPYYFSTLFIITAFPCIFFIFISSYLIYQGKLGLAVIDLILYILTLCFYFLASCTDPGIVPRRNISSALNIGSESENEPENFRMCTTCYTYRLKRSHHCRECDNCVEVFDHHCKFLNNCIGARNYTFFFFFIIFLSLFCIFVVISCFTFIFSNSAKEGYGKETRITSNRDFNLAISVLLIVICTVLGFLPTLLCLQHFSMCFTGQTTKERAYGKEGSGICFMFKRKPSMFDPQLALSEAQLRIIMSGPVPIVQPEQINIELSSAYGSIIK